jgi:hypothetical protein
MLDYLRVNASQIADGLLFGLGVLAVYLGAVFTGALVRSLGGVGSKGLTSVGRYMQGWFFHLRGDAVPLAPGSMDDVLRREPSRAAG